MIRFLAAVLALCVSTGAQADGIRIASPKLTIKTNEIGFVLHGPLEERNVDRVLQPGKHAKIPFVEKVVVMNTARVRSRALRVVDALSDGQLCWVKGRVYYEIADPEKAFAWRKARGLPLDTIDAIRHDYEAPMSHAKGVLRGAIVNASAQGAADGAVRSMLREDLQEPGKLIFWDGTRIVRVRYFDTNCDTFAEPTSRPSSARVKPNGKPICPPRLYKESITYPDRQWSYGDRPATSIVTPGYSIVIMASDYTQITTHAPRVGIRPRDDTSWASLMGKQEDDAKRVAGRIVKEEIQALWKKVGKDRWVEAANSLSLEDLAKVVDAHLEPLGYELVQIDFAGTKVELVDEEFCDRD